MYTGKYSQAVLYGKLCAANYVRQIMCGKLCAVNYVQANMYRELYINERTLWISFTAGHKSLLIFLR
jgi:hypothetical protein